LPVVLRKIGAAERNLGRTADAVRRYLEALAIGRELVTETGESVGSFTDLVPTLIGLADLDDQPLARLDEALAIVTRLDAEGQLPPLMQDWVAEITARREALVPVEP
jgi:hypothetical protein